MESIEDFPLLLDIQQALIAHGNAHSGIRISITPEPQEIWDDDEEEYVLMKCLCWNLTDATDGYLTDRILALVHPEHTEAEIEADLHRFFPGRRVVVDNEIYIEDDEE